MIPMLLRDRLAARLAEMGDAPDHQRLVAEVLGIRNAPPELARRLVAQALVVEAREDAWRRTGDRVCAEAPDAPGVYILRDDEGRAVYVGKAVNVRRRLRAHFARRRWPALKAGMTRASAAEWQVVGSELEALVREAALIRELQPLVNVQIGLPVLETRGIPKALARDVIVVLPSIEDDSVELFAARGEGPLMIQRTRRSGADLLVHTTRLTRFFHSPLSASGRRAGETLAGGAPFVFSWLAGRGGGATRIDPHDVPTRPLLAARLAAILGDEQLFVERVDQRFFAPQPASRSAR